MILAFTKHVWGKTQLVQWIGHLKGFMQASNFEVVGMFWFLFLFIIHNANKFYAKGNFMGLSCKELIFWILWMLSQNGFFFYIII